MSPKLFVSLALLVLLLLSVALILQNYSMRENARQFSSDVTQVKASLDSLRLVVDSLKAQTPGLGEYMSTIQLHAAKLWFASQASNWKLAAYELDELEETMEAAEALHERKNNVDITSVLQSVRQTQVPQIGKSIAMHNVADFRSAYGQLLGACNGCHQPAGYEFIHIVTPTREPVSNQLWKIPNM